MVLSVQRGVTQYISGGPLKEQLLTYFEEKSLNCPHIQKLRLFFKMRFSSVEGLNTMCTIFPFQNDLLACSLSIQRLFNKIPVLFLQIQGVFNEKVIFKEFFKDRAVFPGVFLARANHVL